MPPKRTASPKVGGAAPNATAAPSRTPSKRSVTVPKDLLASPSPAAPALPASRATSRARTSKSAADTPAEARGASSSQTDSDVEVKSGGCGTLLAIIIAVVALCVGLNAFDVSFPADIAATFIATAAGGTHLTTTRPFPGTCGCYDSSKVKSALLKQLALPSNKGKTTGYIVQNQGPDAKAFGQQVKDLAKTSFTTTLVRAEDKGTKPVSVTTTVDQCVEFYELPTTMSGPRALLNYMQHMADPKAACHVWVLREVIDTSASSSSSSSGWSEDAWNGLKELFDQQTLAGERLVMPSSSPSSSSFEGCNAIVVRAEGSATSLRELGMPARVGFVMRTLNNL